MNKNAESIVEEAITDMFCSIQKAVGQTDGGFASTYFSGGEPEDALDELKAVLNDYTDREIEIMEADVEEDEKIPPTAGYEFVQDIGLETGEYLEIWRHPGGGLFAVDFSYIDQVSDTVYEPFEGNRVRLLHDCDK